ncbi:hypothetical protein Mkiyose1088_01930 [Mycobacterium kiyosense]|nr:hypothetical protein IWGMT90018_47690 [Mycobacterium kiyosense]GLB87505.1 hypothetical protein SRL2020130_03220 [Mycobacterium kiyosense]GLB99446.1 hypothetical protein SRL2020400_00380 [Mycobacterium kiyosense]GLC06365.1 hypothetical protein SRL2020411_10110 [Mycobacterium kiyosense]GLC11718.1 hypothetical protein SRL2020448_03210 [Mycobacterium kiyosense]
MAADADTPDRKLTKTSRRARFSLKRKRTDDGASPTAKETESPTAELEQTDDVADEIVDYDTAVEDGDAVAEDYDAAVKESADNETAVNEDAENEDAESEDEDDVSEDAAPVRRSHLRQAAMVGTVIIVALAATVGWLGFRSYESHQAETQRQMFLQIGRQCALNLTTIDWQHAEGDVQRVLDSATGQFYDQFSKRKQPFIDVLKKAQSKSVGTITEAGVESESGDKAQVLVAVSIKTTNLGAEEQAPRQWRMRITVEKSGGDTKVSNVAFVA